MIARVFLLSLSLDSFRCNCPSLHLNSLELFVIKCGRAHCARGRLRSLVMRAATWSAFKQHIMPRFFLLTVCALLLVAQSKATYFLLTEGACAFSLQRSLILVQPQSTFLFLHCSCTGATKCFIEEGAFALPTLFFSSASVSIQF